MKSQQNELILTESQIQTAINATKTLQILMKSIQSVLNFVVLTKVVLRKVAGVAFGRFSSIIWISALVFLYTKLQDVWPQLTLYSTQLWDIISSATTLLRGPLKEYCMEVLQDIQETNPELFEKLQNRLQNIETIVALPKFIIQKSFDVIKLSENRVKPLLLQYFLPPLQEIFMRSYQKYLLSKEALSSFSPNELLQGEWGQELLRMVLRYRAWMKGINTDKPLSSKL